jgi:hypothetical protein
VVVVVVAAAVVAAAAAAVVVIVVMFICSRASIYCPFLTVLWFQVKQNGPKPVQTSSKGKSTSAKDSQGLPGPGANAIRSFFLSNLRRGQISHSVSLGRPF